MTVGQLSSLLSTKPSTYALQIHPVRKIGKDKAANPPHQPFALPCFLMIVWKTNQVCSGRIIKLLLWGDEQLSKVLKFRVLSAWRSPPLFHLHPTLCWLTGCSFPSAFSSRGLLEDSAQKESEQVSRSHLTALVRSKKRQK